jgi:(2R)-ethylmalonyl-CoA mutase
LTESQPENNLQRIVLETLGVTLSRDARARAIQLPAWNEALGLPRPWDQQWSLRIQQVLAYETDLLEYPDLFEGSAVMERLTGSLAEAATAELDQVLDLGGIFSETVIGELKGRLVRSQAERTRRIESGELPVVGVNVFTSSDGSGPSPLDGAESILRVDPAVEAALIEGVEKWRASRSSDAVTAALDALQQAASSGTNIMPSTVALAHAGGTTGEWADALRAVFGEYRAPTGVSGGVGLRRGEMAAARERVTAVSYRLGGPPKLLVAKPGLDGHSNGAEQVAVAARDAGFEVVYPGIRSTPAEIAAVARDEDVDLVGLSILSGSHLELVPAVVGQLRALGVDVPVVVGGIIPSEDVPVLEATGVSAVFTPKDFDLTRIVEEMAGLVGQLSPKHSGESSLPPEVENSPQKARRRQETS